MSTSANTDLPLAVDTGSRNREVSDFIRVSHPYKPLSGSRIGHPVTIRIFSLAPGLADSPISGTLVETPFDSRLQDEESLDYECMSYAWGDPSRSTYIDVDGCSVSVTPNLKSGLQQLRLPDRSRRLWIDAICINQDDVHERSQQVGLMQYIYERAVGVLVWLGEAGNGSNVAFKALKDELRRFGPEILEACGEPFTQHPLFMSLSPFDALAGCLQSWLAEEEGAPDHEAGSLLGSHDESGNSQTGQTEPNAAQARLISQLAVCLLMDLPFFKRVWVVQEVVAAKKVLVCCGGDELDWSLLHLGLAFFLHGSSKAPSLQTGLHRFVHITLARQQVQSRDYPQRSELSNALVIVSILQRHREAQATDKRDKIYALIGLLGKMGVPIGISPDYSLNYRAVYVKFARTTIETCRNLDILSIPHGTGLDLPSWVPDWSDSNGLPNSLFELERGARGKIPDAEAFSASGTFYLEPDITFHETELVLSGHEMDSLEKVADPFEWLDGSETVSLSNKNNFIQAVNATTNPEYDATTDPALADLRQQTRIILQLYLEFYNTMSRWKELADETTAAAYPTGKDSETVLFLTLEGVECSTEGDSYPFSFIKTAKRWQHFFASLEQGADAATRMLNGDTSVKQDELYAPVGWADEDGTSKVWDAPLYGPVNHRRLARTKQGYLALVGPEARGGDDIVLLHGGRTPYILRRTTEGTKFISDAYVHGIMYGEAWDRSRCHEIRLV